MKRTPPRFRKAQGPVRGKKKSLPPEKRGRILLANLSLFLMLLGTGSVAIILVLFAVLFFMGGTELVSDFINSKPNETVDHSIFWVLILAFGPGAVQGVWLWSKLMRKTGFISSERVKSLSGFG